MGELVRRYASVPLGGTNASVVAVAERVMAVYARTGSGSLSVTWPR
jgi:hypothetical protein